jgi:hypothetical protein
MDTYIFSRKNEPDVTAESDKFALDAYRAAFPDADIPILDYWGINTKAGYLCRVYTGYDFSIPGTIWVYKAICPENDI